jgi:hypothetical protein
VNGRASLVALAFCLTLPACDMINLFCGTSGDAPPAPPDPVSTAPTRARTRVRPPECQAAMQLISSCKEVTLASTRITAVAECEAPGYYGDSELMAFLRCMGTAPDCARLQACSGPIGTLTPAVPEAPLAPSSAPAPVVAPTTTPTGSG